MYRILIVEDNPVIAKGLADHLEKWTYEVHVAQDFQNIMETFTAVDPGIVLMDISLPFFSGYHWCSEIRKLSKVPIVFISSASDNMNIVMAMNMGGDDFIPKPFDLTVAVAKIQALLRRTYAYQGHSELLEHCGAILNLTEASLLHKGKIIELTKNEFRILHLLMASPGEVISRDSIIARLWEDESFIDDNTLTVNVTRLRKKLASIGLEDFIRTRKGIGYMVTAS